MKHNNCDYSLRNQCGAFAFVMLFSILGLFSSAPAHAQGASARCQVPIEWRVGRVDLGFDISKAKFHRLANSAARRWNRVLGRALFKYSQRAKFKVNLRYGLHQEAAEAIQDITAHTEQGSQMLDGMMLELNKLMRKYEADLARYKRSEQAFSTAADQFATKAEKGARDQQEHRQLLAEQGHLKRRRAGLVKQQGRLERARIELEKFRSTVNQRVKRHNNNVSQANQTLMALPEEAHQLGVTHINGPRSKIDLLQYYDDATMYVTLLHEFGHALGLQHIGDRKAVMNARRSEYTATDLTRADVRALRERCKR